MLAIQKITITYRKSDRYPECAAKRETFMQPLALPSEINGAGDYLESLQSYCQDKDIYPPDEYYKALFVGKYDKDCKNRKSYPKLISCRYTDDFHTNCVDVNKDGNDYIINWNTLYKSGCDYHPVRNGHNKDFNNKDSTFFGMDLVNETAFILEKGESGVMNFNFRFREEESNHFYENTRIYFINTDVIVPDIFIKAEYEKKYDQNAILL